MYTHAAAVAAVELYRQFDTHIVSNALETLLKREKLLRRLSFGRLAGGHHRL
jgi:hypothetical protein